MAFDLSRHIGDLDELMLSEQRIHASGIPDRTRVLWDWGDLDELGFIYGAESRISDAAAQVRASDASAGLVSVPTRAARRPMPKHRLTAQANALTEQVARFVRPGGPLSPGRRDYVAGEALREREAGEECFFPDPALNRMARLRRSVGFAARAQRVGADAAGATEVLMVTCTYRPGVEWEAGHIRTLIRRMRDWHRRRGLTFRYLWVAEIQDGKRRADGEGRGVIHYHIAFWVPPGTRLPFADEQGWWPHGSTRTEVARGATQYLMHYLKKGDSKNFERMPRGARTHGCGGLEHAMRRARRWLGLPGFVQARSSIFDDWRRAPGGGWVSPAKPDGTREHFRSEFARIVVAGRTGLERVCTHERPADFAPSGPFSWITDRARAEASRRPAGVAR